LRVTLIVGLAANVCVATMLLVHTFVTEPASEIPLHKRLVGASVFALLISVAVAVLAWRNLLRREATLREGEGERLFRKYADTSPLMLWVNDVDARCIFANKTWRQFTGQSLEQIRGDGWADPIHPDDRQRVYDDFMERASRREPVYIEYRVRRHDGVYRWILDTGYPRYDESALAREVARHLGTEHHELRISAGEFAPALLDTILDHVGQPLGDLGSGQCGVEHIRADALQERMRRDLLAVDVLGNFGA
jgi:PAS domain S-box-containing protein